MIYVIIADGSVDQIVDTDAIAKREAKDLRKLGCEVKVKAVADWQAAYEIETKLRGY